MKPSLTSVWRRPDTHGSFATLMPLESTQIPIPCKNQHVNFVDRLGMGEPEHLRMRWRDVWTREKNAVPPDVALERRTKRVIPGFQPVRSLLDAVGPSLLSATDLASRYGIEGEICRPLNHMWQNPTPTHSSRPPLSLQFRVRFRPPKYSRENSIYLPYGKHWSSRLRSVRTRPSKGNIHA